jgi:hypothetical protein
MFRVLVATLAGGAMAVSIAADSRAMLRVERTSPGDLEVGGELRGLPRGSTRYLRYEDLLRLPQQSYTVSNDSNLPRNTVISGVGLDALAQRLGARPDSILIVAICDDQYRANYPRDYIAEHHPLLVLRINGRLRDHWPPANDGGALWPYLISHPFFKPAFKVLSHEDEPQLPYGVTCIELRRESEVLRAIRPPGNSAADLPVEQGYLIARQDCFRCHNMGSEGGLKAGRTWLQLAAIAQSDPLRFRQIVRDPSSVTPGAKMPGQPAYDNATLIALTEYFKSFSISAAGKRSSP